MQICGDFSLDLKAKYRLLVKDLRRPVLPCMGLGAHDLRTCRILHSAKFFTQPRATSQSWYPKGFVG
jgi:hypothetical protein